MCKVGPIYCASHARKNLVRVANDPHATFMEQREARLNYDATKTGLKELRKLRDTAVEEGKDTPAIEVLNNRIEAAEKKRKDDQRRHESVVKSIEEGVAEAKAERSAEDVRRDLAIMNDETKSENARLAAKNRYELYSSKIHRAQAAVDSLPENKKQLQEKAKSEDPQVRLHAKFRLMNANRYGAEVTREYQNAYDELEAARQCERNEYESFQRSGTDGFLSQWASSSVAREHRAKARLIKNGGKAKFPALFDLEGNRIKAVEVTTDNPYGYGTRTSWMRLDSEEERGGKSKWFNPSQASNPETALKNNAKKGYYEGYVVAPAEIEARAAKGSYNVSYASSRIDDRNFDEELIVDNGQF